jgi:hypothetical protein
MVAVQGPDYHGPPLIHTYIHTYVHTYIPRGCLLSHPFQLIICCHLIIRLYIQDGSKVTLPKYSLVLTVMFRFKPAMQCVERSHSVVSRVLNMEDLISNNFAKLMK